MSLIYIVIVYFIKYELDEFELNWVNVYVWYDVYQWLWVIWNSDWDVVSSEKDIHIDTHRCLRYVLFWKFDLRSDSTIGYT